MGGEQNENCYMDITGSVAKSKQFATNNVLSVNQYIVSFSLHLSMCDTVVRLELAGTREQLLKYFQTRNR